MERLRQFNDDIRNGRIKWCHLHRTHLHSNRECHLQKYHVMMPIRTDFTRHFNGRNGPPGSEYDKWCKMHHPTHQFHEHQQNINQMFYNSDSTRQTERTVACKTYYSMADNVFSDFVWLSPMKYPQRKTTDYGKLLQSCTELIFQSKQSLFKSAKDVKLCGKISKVDDSAKHKVGNLKWIYGTIGDTKVRDVKELWVNCTGWAATHWNTSLLEQLKENEQMSFKNL